MFEISFLVAATIAGVLTILAPCIVPVLPIVLGGSVGHKSRIRPLVIIGSLMLSIIVFTLTLKVITTSLGLTLRQLQITAGWILVVFGFLTIFPTIWEQISLKLGLSKNSNVMMGKFLQRGDTVGDALVGASLGPVFTSCSPTYAVIVGLVLSGDSLGVATIYLVAYAAGLGLMLLLIAIAGQRLVSKLGWATNPTGNFKRLIGVLFLIVGLSIVTGFDKQIETWLLEQGFYEPIAEFESTLID